MWKIISHSLLSSVMRTKAVIRGNKNDGRRTKIQALLDLNGKCLGDDDDDEDDDDGLLRCDITDA